MRIYGKSLATLITLLALGSAMGHGLRPAEAQVTKGSKGQWAIYGNARYKYFVEYPKNLLTPQPEAPNGDGRLFLSSNNKVRMLVYGSNNVLDETIATRFKRDSRAIESGDNVTYKAQKKNWYAVSGYRGDTVFYRKTFLHDDQFITLDITYPRSDHAIWDKVVSQITPTFRLGK